MTVEHVYVPAGTSDEETAVLMAASNGGEETRSDVRALFQRKPELAKHVACIARTAEHAVIECGKGQILVREATRAELRSLRASLAEPRDSELERLLVERVSLCWLAVQHAEVLRANRWSEGVETKVADFWDRHVASLNREFLRASKTLATVRRLRLPAVQVNIGEQQVNVAS